MLPEQDTAPESRFFVLQVDTRLEREIMCHRGLSHNNIIKLLEVAGLALLLPPPNPRLSSTRPRSRPFLPCPERGTRHAAPAHGIQVFLTPEYLGIVMEHASNGELFEYVASKGKMIEPEARYFFQQLICGVEYCHKMVRPRPRGGGGVGSEGCKGRGGDLQEGLR